MSSAPASHEARCAAALDLALAHVPAYRSWRAFDPGPGATVDARFRALPALTKPLMNLFGPPGFVPDDRELEAGLRSGEIEIVTTSGTTDDKVQNAWWQPWWDASERASWALNAHARRAATGDHREAILVCPLNVGIPSETPLPFERRRLARFLYLNELVDPLAWPESHFRRMLDELASFRPAVLEANPSYLARLCRFARRAGIRPFQPALVTLTYEYPSLLHLRHIRAVFDAPVVSSYGTTEAGYVFMECERGRLHENTASCRVDFLPFAADRGDPAVGKLLVTSLDNPWRALVRFDTGDLGRLAEGPCPCGRREGLTLTGIEGRAINLTLTPGERLVTQAEVDRRLAAVAGVDEYQLLQTDARSYELRVCSDADQDDPATAETAAARAAAALSAIYGPGARISAARVAAIPPEPSGKFRLVKATWQEIARASPSPHRRGDPASSFDAMGYVAPELRPPLPPEARASAPAPSPAPR